MAISKSVAEPRTPDSDPYTIICKIFTEKPSLFPQEWLWMPPLRGATLTLGLLFILPPPPTPTLCLIAASTVLNGFCCQLSKVAFSCLCVLWGLGHLEMGQTVWPHRNGIAFLGSLYTDLCLSAMVFPFISQIRVKI